MSASAAGLGKGRRSLLRDSLSVVGTKLFVLLLAVLSVVVQARALGPEGRGLLAALIVLPQMLIPFAAIGVNHSLAYHIGQRTFDPGRLYGSLLYVLAVSSLLAIGIVAWIHSQSPKPLSTLMILGAAGIVPISVLLNAIKGLCLGHDRVAEFNRVFWLEKVVMVGGLVALWLVGVLTVTTALYAAVAASLVVLVVAATRVPRPRLTSWRVDRGVARQLLGKGMVLAVTMFLLELLLKIDIYLLSWLGGERMTGHYAVAVQVGGLLWQIPLGLGVVVLSRSANQQAHGGDWNPALARAVRLSLWGVIGLGAGASLVAPWIFPWLLGAEFAPSVPLFQLLVPGIVLLTVFQLLHMNMAGQGRVWVPLLILAPCVVGKIAFTVWVIPEFGATGAAVVSSIAYAAAALGMAVYFSGRAGLSLLDLLLVKKPDFELVFGLVRGLSLRGKTL